MHRFIDRIKRFGARIGNSRRLRIPRELNARIGRDRLTSQACVLAYNFFLALPAALVFLVSALAFLPISDVNQRIIDQMQGVFPPDTISLVQRTLETTFNRGAGKISLLAVSFVGAVWAMANGYASLMSALNRVHGISERRGWAGVKIRSVLLSLVAAVLIVATFALIIIVPSIASWMENRAIVSSLAVVLRLIRWPAIVVLALAGIEISYRYAPCAGPRLRFVSPGTIAAALFWMAATLAFGLYVSNFASYDKVYGTLGAVIALLTWIWLSSVVFLIGAEINQMWITHRGRWLGHPVRWPQGNPAVDALPAGQAPGESAQTGPEGERPAA